MSAGADGAARPGSRLSPLTVGQVNAGADAVLREGIGPVWVVGELTGFKAHASGHWYFQLREGKDAVVSCAMFRGRNLKVRFQPEDGLAVLALATPGVYAAAGRYQLLVESLEPRGAGAAAIAYEQLKQRLQDEGLFDEGRKKSLPLLPRRIGIVTSRDGAALHDVVRVLRRRFAGVHVLLASASVQGSRAPEEIADALRALDRLEMDVLLLVRGGGSREDLAAFDDERVVRAVAACSTPVVSGIGHEVDVSLADLAADVRAPTPSAAAEIVVRERRDLLARVEASRQRAVAATRGRLAHRRAQVSRLAGARGVQGVAVRVSRVRLHVAELARALDEEMRLGVRARRQHLADLARRLDPASHARRITAQRRDVEIARHDLAARMRARLAAFRHALADRAGRLDALSPLAVLARGYALARIEGRIVRDVANIAVGDIVDVRVARGRFTARVTDRVVPTSEENDRDE